MKTQICINYILYSAQDDWVQACDVWSAVRVIAGVQGDEETRAISIQIISEFLRNGIFVAGDIEEGFVPWPIPVEAAIERIEKSWKVSRRGPIFGEVCWLNLTEKGEALAFAVDETQIGDIEAQ